MIVDPADDFLSGTSGEVSGIRRTTVSAAADALADALTLARLQPARLKSAARKQPRRQVLALAVEHVGEPNLLRSARQELLRSHHHVQFASAAVGKRGKFENLNALLQRNPVADSDWLVVIDDDVVLPAGFLDAFIFLAERFSLSLAQPAHRHRSHAAWQVARRRNFSVVRETVFVEIGPVFAFQANTFDLLLPFPSVRGGWGLDLHWSALARAQGWRLGVVDATPVGHGLRRVASLYDSRNAIDEAREFLSGRPYVTAQEAQRTLMTHRSWR